MLRLANIQENLGYVITYTAKNMAKDMKFNTKAVLRQQGAVLFH